MFILRLFLIATCTKKGAILLSYKNYFIRGTEQTFVLLMNRDRALMYNPYIYWA